MHYCFIKGITVTISPKGFMNVNTFGYNIKSSLLSFSLGYRKSFNSENPQVA